MTDRAGNLVSRRHVLAGLMATVATPALAEAPARSLRPMARPGSAVRAPGLPDIAALAEQAGIGGKVSVALAEAGTGRIVQEHGAALRLPPASVAKVMTTCYALEALGPDYVYETRLFAEGAFSGGILDGNLILSGSGDPMLTTDDLGALAKALAAAGIREVTGGFHLWQNALPYQREIDPGQLPHLGYNPALSGLNLNSNVVHFEWAKAGADYRLTMDARSSRYRPDVSMARMTAEDRDLPVYTYQDGGNYDQWTVARSALGNDGARGLPVRYPALFAGDVFRTLAAGEGIRLPAGQNRAATPRGEVIASHKSRPMSEILRLMLKYSTNLTAEAVGLKASLARGKTAASLAASAQEMARWALETKGVACQPVDHSGLGDRTRISAAALARFLGHADVAGRLPPLLKEVGVFDSDGRPLTGKATKVFAKTGTLNFVSSLAGYVQREGQGDLVFAILSADEDRRAASHNSQDEVPPGARRWSDNARWLQHRLLRDWISG